MLKMTANADATRRAALALPWGGGEYRVCELMARLDASQSRTSRHLKVLREAGLVLHGRDAQGVRYRRDFDLAAVIDAGLAAEGILEARIA